MKLLVCFGTRPEAIKMALICLELKKQHISYELCVTGQHREMLDQVLDFFDLKPDYDLDLMAENQSLNLLSAGILEGLDGVLKKDHFDLVLVHGDTTTSVMAALAAFNSGIKVAHVESGLRTYNKLAPFPEELNRQLTTRIADYHFPPTKKAEGIILNEGVSPDNINLVGNTVVDALQFTINKIHEGFNNEEIHLLSKLVDSSVPLILVTGHRRENMNGGLREVFEAIQEIASKNNVQVVFPVHLNPNVKRIAYEMLSETKNVHLIAPLNYPAFIWMMSKSSLIISDSGGIQEEAPSLNIPVLITRSETERIEGIDSGCSFLVGTNKEKIIKKSIEILSGSTKLDTMINPFGDGNASRRIVDFIKHKLSE